MTINVRKSTILILAGILTIFTLGPAFAQGGPKGHKGPPPEAYTACEGKSEGDTAAFENPQGDTVTGTCVQERDGDQLVLRPDNPPDRENQDRQNE
ncbi:hypothetical protein HRM2_40870 [Desulforapulum autotrophicum HRM2]|jgi:hypothetical protein|uniref:DUF2282 domain-containing protein n=1 Tax=Desulforapulum autotrophicum (strain ATCC 43914 / DSM 3382 / VKM B-1955 / HRM2) TaxID=177437 RepID=C0QCC7_DESAH|nr:hypothetical protein [Desulforapulum autotrophicum]ACN17144.1 hypothetical protein HRM2_40870 [Desulforapulum autotrophicum HRM2]